MMGNTRKIMGIQGDYVVLDKPWEWEEKEADYKWFEELLASGGYEDGCPLVRIHNLDEWDGEDPHFEFQAEFTRNPVNLFARYLIEKYEWDKGIYFFRLFGQEIGLFVSPQEKRMSVN
jgi:hypothetical protein